MSVSTKGVGRIIPLWKQKIPRYPVYWSGNPQLRVFLPQFWMKLLKPEKKIPPDQVHFEVHPQMSRLDIKQYLEKIYSVPVLNVRTKVIQGKEIKHPVKNHIIARMDDYKLAYVQLGEGHTFEFPDIFEKQKPESEKQVEEYKKTKQTKQLEERKYWDKISLPPWFR